MPLFAVLFGYVLQLIGLYIIHLHKIETLRRQWQIETEAHAARAVTNAIHAERMRRFNKEENEGHGN